MKYTLANPVQVGDLTNPITVDSLEVGSFSMNFEPSISDSGNAILSVVLVHRASGYKMNIVYQNADALAFWTERESVLGTDIFNKLISDGKLPNGSLSE